MDAPLLFGEAGPPTEPSRPEPSTSFNSTASCRILKDPLLSSALYPEPIDKSRLSDAAAAAESLAPKSMSEPKSRARRCGQRWDASAAPPTPPLPGLATEAESPALRSR